MPGFVDCWNLLASKGNKEPGGAPVLSDADRGFIEERIQEQVRAGYSPIEAAKMAVQKHLGETIDQHRSIYEQAGVKLPEPPKPPPPAAPPNTRPPTAQSVGISQARTEAELGSGSVEPGTGNPLGTGLAYGRNYINKGGDPRLPIRRAIRTGLSGENEVGIVHAELERLRAERARAAQAFEANPDDPVLAVKLEDADSAQREWRKELQPVLTAASAGLREAYAMSVPEIDPGTYQGLADLFDEHFKGERDITPEMRTEMAKAAKGYREVRDSANAEFGKIEQELTKRIRGKKVMTPDELDADLRSVLEDAFKDCVLS